MKFASTALVMALNASLAMSFSVVSNIVKKIPKPSEVIDLVIDEIADNVVVDVNSKDFSLETKLFLGEITCAVTRSLAVGVGPILIKSKEEGGVGNNFDLKTEQVNVGWKKVGPKWIKSIVLEKEEKISDKWTTSILLQDDMSKNNQTIFETLESELKSDIFGDFINSNLLLDIEDSIVPIADEAQAARMAKDFKFVQGEALPLSYNTDFNMQTDESFSRIFFHGIGAPLLAISEAVTDPEYLKYGPYMVDLGFMKTLKLRSDEFKCYGARVHFDENQMVSAIYCSDADELFLPGEPGWEEAKFQAKTSAFVLSTFREHLSQTHLIVSNDASREIVKTLHPEHPIRRLLSIFAYNAVSVNLAAFQVLAPKNSIIHRGTSLDYEDGVKKVFDNAYTTSRAYEPFPERQIKNPALTELAKEGKFPYLKEGKESYDIIYTMVGEWLDEAGDEAKDQYALDFYEAMKTSSEGQEYELPEYSYENMKYLITTIAFTVTAYHEIIGHVPDYTDSPYKASLRLTKASPNKADLQSFIIAAAVAGATSPPAPQLLAEFPYYIGAGGAPEWETKVWRKFLVELGLQAKKVQKANRERDFEFHYFDPSLYECSVSV